MDLLLTELAAGWPDAAQVVRVTLRLLVAALLGALIGLQREHAGKAAGLRTHMLVSLGAALFVVAAIESGLSSEGVSRVIQGLVTGIGFIGAGAILKLELDRRIKGLTSAAGLWLAAAVGVAAGLGRWALATIGALLVWLILGAVMRFEQHDRRDAEARADEPD